MINIRTNITFKDFLNYNLYKYYKNPIQIILLLAGVLVVIVWLIALISNYPFDRTLTIVAVACLLQFGLVVPIRIYLSSRREYKVKKEFHAPIEFTFTKEGIKSESVYSKNFSNWETIDKITETKSWFILYFNKHLATIIPLSSFRNSEQILQFKAIINAIPTIKSNFK